MKRKLVFLVLLCMMMSMCACSLLPEPPAPPAPTPEFDIKPVVTEAQVFIDGKELKEVYKKNEAKYICLDEVLDLLDGSIVTAASIKQPYTATVMIDKKTYIISNEEDVLREGEQNHPLVLEPIYDGEQWYVPMAPIMSLLNFHMFEDTKRAIYYFTKLPSTSDIPAGKNIPTLMYHAVSDNTWGISELFVSPAELEKQLVYLKDNGYTTITFEDFDNLANIEKPVLLTFDDGYEDNYTNLLPLLKKYKAKATVFVITGEIGNEHYMNAKQVKEMSDSGLVSIQSHTVTHPYLADLNEEKMETELYDSKCTLARITRKEPFVLGYPNGSYSNASIAATQQHYSFGLLMNGGMYTTGTHDLYQIPRIYISRNTDIYTFAYNLQ